MLSLEHMTGEDGFMREILLFLFLGGGDLVHRLLGGLLGGLLLLLLLLDGLGGGWTPVVEMAHLVISMRTRSSLVSMTRVSGLTMTILPTMPPMVVITSPFFRLSRISWAFFFRLFSGRISRK